MKKFLQFAMIMCLVVPLSVGLSACGEKIYTVDAGTYKNLQANVLRDTSDRLCDFVLEITLNENGSAVIKSYFLADDNTQLTSVTYDSSLDGNPKQGTPNNIFGISVIDSNTNTPTLAVLNPTVNFTSYRNEGNELFVSGGSVAGHEEIVFEKIANNKLKYNGMTYLKA